MLRRARLLIYYLPYTIFAMSHITFLFLLFSTLVVYSQDQQPGDTTNNATGPLPATAPGTPSLKEETKKLEELIKKVDDLKKELDESEDKVVRFGLSVAYRTVRSRYINNGDFQTASISPIDTTLQLENLDKEGFVISTSVVITPFIKSKWLEAAIVKTKSEKKSDKMSWLKLAAYQFLSNIGVQANVNLIDFAESQEQFSFNKSLEGGLGLAYRLSDRVYLSAHHELFYSRQLRKDIKAQVGNKIYDSSGSLVTDISQLDPKNDNYFTTKNILGYVHYRIIVVF